MLGIVLGVKEYADYEITITEWISRLLGVVPITSMPLWVAYDQNLDFSSYIEFDRSYEDYCYSQIGRHCSSLPLTYELQVRGREQP